LSDAAKLTINFRVNGQKCSVEAYPMARLLDVLREQLHLTGTKEGCGEGECGACSVLIGDNLVNSCLVPMAQIEDASITTIEGIAADHRLHAVQESFIACGGAQCGICTPGMIMAAINLLRCKPNPADEEIKEGLAGNLCRCTGYMRILEAVRQASQRMAAKETPA
jgi:carbon-monoxide dehydrogenase small subunit